MLFELPVLDPKAARPEPAQERLWRSLSHFENAPAYREMVRDEFAPGGADAPGGASRRQFLQIMGASIALGGLVGCRKPEEKILPYTRKPEEIVEGIPLYYATAMPMRGVLSGLLVESHEGRPTKVEGNPQHPTSRGATSVFAQASVLNLYDPFRSREVRRERAAATWADFVAFSRELGARSGGGRLVVLSEATSSPTLLRLRQELLGRYAGASWVTYEDGGEEPSALGMQTAFGRPLRPLYQFSRADVVVSLDGDFLGPTDINHVYNMREYAERRRMRQAGDTPCRLYVVESAYTTTGGMADHRLRLRSSEIPGFAAALAARLGVGGSPGAEFTDHPFVAAMAEDLLAARGRGVVLAGDTQPPAVHALAARINQALGNVGQAVQFLDTGAPTMRSQADELRDLVAAMQGGAVDTLLIVGANPVYSAPAELDFAAALQRVPNTVHLGDWIDETAALCRWHIPRSHYLESWGDGRAYDGTLSVVQPLIAPLYDTKSEIEVVNTLATGLDANGYDLVRSTWQSVLPGDFEEAWRRVLHDGYLADSGYLSSEARTAAGAAMSSVLPIASAPPGAPVAGQVTLADTTGQGRMEQEQDLTPEDEMAPEEAVEAAPEATGAGVLEVVFRLDPTLYDGRFANNVWMLECPDPITKIVWDNVAVMSPTTAERLDLSAEFDDGQYTVDVVALTLNGRTVELPVWIIPGHADDSITVTLGYGRALQSSRPPRRRGLLDFGPEEDMYREGPPANGIGVNVAPLRSPGAMQYAVGAQVRKTGRSYMIASTQDHFVMEGRPIARMGTVADFQANPDFARDMVPVIEGVEGVENWDEFPTIWDDREDAWEGAAFKDNPYYQQQWGMSIDLNTCTGCNACVVACQSENNVMVVGKDQVSRGREMHWLRVDRYFIGDDPLNPDRLALQPMMCVHCEYAPCEQVCPVNATSHSPDGINEMTYNRCIGTRYCSNNCPYKVRRFNFLNWSKDLPLEVQMAQNPNVTVRFRGVMEKCTYCVQRVRHAGYVARREERDILDMEVQTACQQVCPAQAITFGDIVNPYSQVSQLKQSPLSYEVLAELNVRPRTSYLARVLNPSPNLVATPPPAEG